MVLLVGIVVIGLAAWVPRGATPSSPQTLPGWPLYDRYCLACHGSVGDGRGPAAPYTAGRPRDLTRGEYAWRSTSIGQPPTDDDLHTLIRHGVPGTSMPGFALTSGQIDQLADVVKAFAPHAFATRPTPITLPPAPPSTDPSRGAQLWKKHGCSTCHGATGDGDTPSAKAMGNAPYDLTREPLHRPRTTDDRHGRRRAAALSIATGLAGTAMPGYLDSLAGPDLWALADHVLALRTHAATDRAALHDRTIELDRSIKIAAGAWPGSGDPRETALFGGPIAPQGTPPPSLGPSQASLAAANCGRCHAKQYREWQPSIHHGATSPGLAAQMYGLSRAEAAECYRCHAPLAEQHDDPALRADGASCAGCHVRNWMRHGPPNVSPSLLAIPGYPLVTLPIYERADLCLPCHQLPPRTAVAGKPLLDTYREWLEGPYMKRGVQCQHCHMPNREHSFRGVHDREMFAGAIALSATTSVRSAGTAGDHIVTVVADLANVGAGHYLPTTPTPAAWLAIELLDARGAVIPGASAQRRIGRDIWFDGKWHEREDTRIPPGERMTMARAWQLTGTKAVTARLTVTVHPDDYYEHLYTRQLRTKLPAAQRALYEQALAKAHANRYVAERRDVPIH